MNISSLPEESKGKTIESLSRCTLFKALKKEHLEQLASLAQYCTFEPDETIVKVGDPSDSFFVLVDGEAAIIAEPEGEQIEIGRMLAPSSLGELGLLLDTPRTVTVRAASAVSALKYGAKAFDAMFQKIPNFGQGLSQALGARLAKVSSAVHLPDWDLEANPPAADVIGLLPIEFIQRHRVLPVRLEGNILTLGVIEGPIPRVVRTVRTLIPGVDIRTAHVDSALFESFLRSYAGAEGWKGGAAPPKGKPAEAAAAKSPRLDALLERMVAEGASDLHLTAGHKPRWRIDGAIGVLESADPLGSEEVLQLVKPIMEPRHWNEFSEGKDTDLAYELPGTARFRVNVFADSKGVGAVFRQIPTKIVSFEQLGLPKVLKTFCSLPKGLILVTGPTGSGKSTTLAAMIDYINQSRQDHIITLEDPIEFKHESAGCLVNQREIGGHTVSFARALKAALREDPDIVLVGEMRDLETVALTLEIANTGHLVFATLHTNSAISALDRIVDLFPGDQQNQIRTTLADTLRGVVAQTLLKKRGGGRVAALEVLAVNLAVANLIREDKTVQIPMVMQTGKQAGMQTLNDELMKLVDKKKVDYPEALSKSVDKIEFAKRFGKTPDGRPLPPPPKAK